MVIHCRSPRLLPGGKVTIVGEGPLKSTPSESINLAVRLVDHFVEMTHLRLCLVDQFIEMTHLRLCCFIIYILVIEFPVIHPIGTTLQYLSMYYRFGNLPHPQ